MISIDLDLRAVERSFDKLERSQLPFAASMAINQVLGEIKDAEPKALEKELDNPTPYTKRGLFVSRANKRKLNGVVGFKDNQAAYLRYAAGGGKRLPVGRAIVVPVKQRLNKYGNMPKGALSRAKLRGDTFAASKNDPRTAHLAPGIYKRGLTGKRRNGGSGTKGNNRISGSSKRSTLTLLAAFHSSAQYRKQLNFEKRGARLVAKRFSPVLAEQMKKSIRSAR
ncbi:hypothetical protein [Falsihalocynthiibacter sp. CO-5D18]|uniref:hypothetical protein n=1 Tax=Falsihalocynthiibacter sp. CO-5D18 TaxID=3240872 RepID=UPI00350ED2CD